MSVHVYLAFRQLFRQLHLLFQTIIDRTSTPHASFVKVALLGFATIMKSDLTKGPMVVQINLPSRQKVSNEKLYPRFSKSFLSK